MLSSRTRDLSNHPIELDIPLAQAVRPIVGNILCVPVTVHDEYVE
jgi:hypothetical protein